jgi:adenosylcobyric acid synthase
VTLSDLGWLREQGLDQAILSAYGRGSAVVGICGGYQLLGSWLADPAGVEGPAGSAAPGLGLLPVTTEFTRHKQTHQAILAREGNHLRGYEIHTGQTSLGEGAQPFGVIVERSGAAVTIPDGAVADDGRVWGTYLHGVFENDDFRHRWLRGLGWQGEVVSTTALRRSEYDRLADVVEAVVDWTKVDRLLAGGHCS